MDNMIPMPTQKNVDGIAPVAQVRICRGIPWDSSYNHVRLFNSREELFAYVDSKAIYATDNAAPVKRGYADFAAPVNELYADSANYIAFKNVGYMDNWMYGFITSVEPLSVNSCRVHFIMDVWTNCQFDMVLNKCYIERQIVKKSDDVIGKYTFPEGLETGEYIVKQETEQNYDAPELSDRNIMSVVIPSAFDESGNFNGGEFRDGVYTAITFNVFDNGDGVNEFLIAANANGTIDGILNAFMMPTSFIAEETQFKQLNLPKKYDNIDGYIPKNKKLFCYPYNFLYGNNNNGTGIEYKYEYFSSNACSFTYTVAMTPNPLLVSYPIQYKGFAQDYTDMLTFSDYPKCAIMTDAYKAYVAQMTSTAGASALMSAGGIVSQGVDTAAGVFSGVGKALSGAGFGFLGAAASGAGSAIATGKQAASNAFKSSPLATLSSTDWSEVIGNGIKSVVNHFLQPSGNVTTSSGNASKIIGNDHISYYPMQIRAEYARKIDDYFTMFGYKIGEIGQPAINNRSAWDFVKTRNCTISGNIDLDYLVVLRSIFDRGVTIWHTNDIGNYGLSNN